MNRHYMKALDEMCSGGLPSETVHLATYMALHPQKRFRLAVLAKHTGIIDVEGHAEELRTRGFIVESGGRWSVNKAPAGEPVEGTSAPNRSAELLLEAYQAERTKWGIRRLRVSEYPYALGKLAPLAPKLERAGIDFQNFVSVVNDGFQFMAEKDPSWNFVRPEQLAGKFAWTIWERQTDSRPGHAGHKYNGLTGLRRILSDAGFGGMESVTEADLKFIERHARTIKAAPGLVETPDRFGPEIMWLVKNSDEDGPVRARA